MLFINFESFAIGVLFATIITKCFDYFICESDLLSFSIYSFCGVILYEIFLFLNKPKPETKNIPELKEFQPSETFSGRIEGYVFKKDIKGQGYYLDN
tara:strand:+ start:2381 stop:2671 length:291 start_codon:yes stop_codon:yes gene_type:complete